MDSLDPTERRDQPGRQDQLVLPVNRVKQDLQGPPVPRVLTDQEVLMEAMAPRVLPGPQEVEEGQDQPDQGDQQVLADQLELWVLRELWDHWDRPDHADHQGELDQPDFQDPWVSQDQRDSLVLAVHQVTRVPQDQQGRPGTRARGVLTGPRDRTG